MWHPQCVSQIFITVINAKISSILQETDWCGSWFKGFQSVVTWHIAFGPGWTRRPQRKDTAWKVGSIGSVGQRKHVTEEVSCLGLEPKTLGSVSDFLCWFSSSISITTYLQSVPYDSPYHSPNGVILGPSSSHFLFLMKIKSQNKRKT